MRTLELRKAQAVERAVDRIRAALGTEWASLTDEEITQLEWVLGELWAYVTRTDWDALHFGRLRMHNVWRILVFGRELRVRSRSTVDILHDVVRIVQAGG